MNNITLTPRDKELLEERKEMLDLVSSILSVTPYMLLGYGSSDQMKEQQNDNTRG